MTKKSRDTPKSRGASKSRAHDASRSRDASTCWHLGGYRCVHLLAPWRISMHVVASSSFAARSGRLCKSKFIKIVGKSPRSTGATRTSADSSRGTAAAPTQRNLS